MSLRSYVAVILLLMVSACKSRDKPSRTDNEPSASESAPVSKARLLPPIAQTVPGKKGDIGLIEARIDMRDLLLFLGDDWMLEMLWANGSKGATIELGGKKTSLDEQGRATTKVSIKDAFFSALSAYKHRGQSYDPISFTIEIPFSVDTGDARAEAKKVTISGAELLKSFIDGTLLKGKPAVMPNESASSEKAWLKVVPDKKLFYLRPVTATFAQTSLVAIDEYLGADKQDCGLYAGERTGKQERVHISFASRKLTVYDRRTGAMLGSQVFKGSGNCPAQVEKSYKIYYPDADAMDAFVTKHLK